MSAGDGMSRKRKTFLKALGIFLALLAGSMFFKGHPRPVVKQTTPTAVKATAPPLPAAEKDRFRLTVKFTDKPGLTQSQPWMPGTVGDSAVWRDSRTGFVWGPMLPKTAFMALGRQELEQARAACAAQEPKGAWQLPLEREMEQARQNGLTTVDKDSLNSWFTYTYTPGGHQRPLGKKWNPKNSNMVYFVRCIARSE
jgi:hypothetical protein